MVLTHTVCPDRMQRNKLSFKTYSLFTLYNVWTMEILISHILIIHFSLFFFSNYCIKIILVDPDKILKMLVMWVFLTRLCTHTTHNTKTTHEDQKNCIFDSHWVIFFSSQKNSKPPENIIKTQWNRSKVLTESADENKCAHGEKSILRWMDWWESSIKKGIE